MDWSVLEPWISASLNARSIAEMGQWTEAELYQYAEEALHDVGGKYLLIAEYDDSIALVPSQAMYELPPLHIVTLYAAADGEMLEPSSVAEMEALDDNWEEAASGTPARWIGNPLGMGFDRIYPPPALAGVLTLIYQKHPPDIAPPTPAAPLSASVLMPAPVGDYLVVKTLEQARTRQGDGQMLDAAQAFQGLGAIYEKAFAAYYGIGS